MKTRRLVVGISGSSGAILGIRLLEVLRSSEIETHLVITPAARLTIEQETDYSVSEVLGLANTYYSHEDIAAPIASGSFDTLGMVVIPCSIKSLSAVANSYTDDLLSRAADVTLKEGRPLLLVVREAPLHRGHVRLLNLAADAGAVIFPPVPAFYTRPQAVDEIVDNIVGRVLRRLGIENKHYLQWQGLRAAKKTSEDIQPPSLQVEALWAAPAMTLATVGQEGLPHAAAVYFAADEARENLYFFSASDSQHSLDIASNPEAAAAIHPQANDWREIRGLQLRGKVTPVPSGEPWDAGWQCYQKKFPFVQELKAELERSTLYTFRPTWVRTIDNRRGFGFKEEWTRA